MKIKLLCVLCAAAVAGCMPMPNYMQAANDSLSYSIAFSPSVSPEGVRGFTAVGHNIVPSYAPAGYSYEVTHRQLIANELGARQYCMSGYTLKKKTMPEMPNGTMYEGVCK